MAELVPFAPGGNKNAASHFGLYRVEVDNLGGNDFEKVVFSYGAEFSVSIKA